MKKILFALALLGACGTGDDETGNAVGAVKQRPKTVAIVLGGLALFLARKPIGRAATKVVSRRSRKGNQDGD